MALQRVGQKRKVVDASRKAEEESDEFLGNGKLDAVLDDGDSEDQISDLDSEDDELDDEVDEEGLELELDSDEIPSSEDEEDLRQQFQDAKRKRKVVQTSAKLMGNNTSKVVIGTTPRTPIALLDQEQRPNFRIEEDANGNPRYVYDPIDPTYDSDDSDAPITTNTIGNIPLSYYDAYPHIGYDINGRKIARPAKGEALDSLLDSIEIPEGWTGLTDPSTGKPLQLSAEELEALKKLTQNEAPGDGYDPYPDMVEYFTGKGMEEIMPLTAAPEPKRRFIPSMHEHKRVMKMVKAIKEGRIRPYRERTDEDRDREEAEQEYTHYDIWSNEAPRPDHPMHMPAPKLPPPGYAESYHPPPEYLPDKQEREAWEQQDEEDRERDFLPEDHSALRKVPGYARFVKEKFERCLDLYLAPRVRRSKLNIDPESLLPRLPNPSELKPFPTVCTRTIFAHQGRVRSIAIDPTARYIASGGDDGTICIWSSGDKYLPVWRVKLSSSEAVNVVSWRPVQQTCILAACCGDTVYFIIPPEIGDTDVQAASQEVLSSGFEHAATLSSASQSVSKDKPSAASWSKPPISLQDSRIYLMLSLRSAPKTLAWHRRGEYLSTVTPSSSSASTSVSIHTLSKHQTQHPFRRLRGLPQTVCFHPSKPLFFVATRQRIRIYNLQEQKLEKQLQPGARWISDISLHPMGDNLLVSSYDKRLLWHDLDLGITPYKTLRYHSKAIRSVQFHPRLPLFADASDDGTLQVFHGKVVNDIMENATVVPLKVLRGHKVKKELGVLDVEWHPTEARLFSAGADGTVKVWE